VQALRGKSLRVAPAGPNTVADAFSTAAQRRGLHHSSSRTTGRPRSTAGAWVQGGTDVVRHARSHARYTTSLMKHPDDLHRDVAMSAPRARASTKRIRRPAATSAGRRSGRTRRGQIARQDRRLVRSTYNRRLLAAASATCMTKRRARARGAHLPDEERHRARARRDECERLERPVQKTNLADTPGSAVRGSCPRFEDRATCPTRGSDRECVLTELPRTVLAPR